MSQVAAVFRVEQSHSRSKKHTVYSTLYVYKKRTGLVLYKKCPFSWEKIKPIYSRGEAGVVSVSVDPGDFLIYTRFVKNFRGKVKGYIGVHSYRGELLYRAKYIDGYVTKSKGNPVYAWLVRILLQTTRIPFKTLKLGDEA
ncbi:MAG: hypothetical protein QXK88_01000 [Desulfurococcaceae archaeon]